MKDRLRASRVVEVLDAIGTSEAKRLLMKLAKGDPASILAKEAIWPAGTLFGKIAHILTDLLRFLTSLVTIVEVVE